jgi:hypothetical protein
LSVAVIAFVLAIVGIGVVLILRDDENPGVAAIPSPSGTSELVNLTDTPTDVVATREEASPTSPRPTPTTSERDQPSPTSNDDEATPMEAEETEERTETPTEEGEVVPTATEGPGATDTPAPLEGEFGFLPPAQLPSGGVSSRLALTFQLAMSLEELPSSGTVFLISWPVYSIEEAEFARDRLGLNGDVIEEGVGVFRVDGADGSLFISPTEIVFRSSGGSGPGDLPDDATAVQVASEWASLSGFVGGDADGGAVVGRDDDSGRVVVKIRPVSPQPNLAPNPSATVTIGPGGEVIEARIAWPASLAGSEYGYSNPVAVWQAVQAGQGFLEADISSVFATGDLTGNATITSYSTAYTLAGSLAGDMFLVPVIVFEGTARIDQTGDEIPVYVSIPVVYHEAGTAG